MDVVVYALHSERGDVTRDLPNLKEGRVQVWLGAVELQRRLAAFFPPEARWLGYAHLQKRLKSQFYVWSEQSNRNKSLIRQNNVSSYRNSAEFCYVQKRRTRTDTQHIRVSNKQSRSIVELCNVSNRYQSEIDPIEIDGGHAFCNHTSEEAS